VNGYGGCDGVDYEGMRVEEDMAISNNIENEEKKLMVKLDDTVYITRDITHLTNSGNIITYFSGDTRLELNN